MRLEIQSFLSCGAYECIWCSHTKDKKLVIASECIHRCTNGVPHTHTHTHKTSIDPSNSLSLYIYIPLPRLFFFSAKVLQIIDFICPVQYTWLQRITAPSLNVTRTHTRTHTYPTAAATTTTCTAFQQLCTITQSQISLQKRLQQAGRRHMKKIMLRQGEL